MEASIHEFNMYIDVIVILLASLSQLPRIRGGVKTAEADGLLLLC